MSADEEELRHKPFAEFGESLKKQLRRERRQALRDRLSRSAPVAPPAPPPPAPPPLSEEELLRQELQGVQPLAGSNYVPPQREAPPLRPRDDEAEAMAALADLVDGRALFDLAESDEYIEGIGQGLNKRLLKKLRQGTFALQAHLDLHGRTRVEARQLVESFIVESRHRGRRCVLIVHGRGLNSKDQFPVLKESLKVWLARGRIARSVLAFCTARPTDGGAGAVYVLLRK